MAYEGAQVKNKTQRLAQNTVYKKDVATQLGALQNTLIYLIRLCLLSPTAFYYLKARVACAAQAAKGAI
jgi:hypothetical protein